MLHVYKNAEMGSDNIQCLDEWPRPKKSKRENVINTYGWESLPAIILDNVFLYLNFEDIISASSTCHNWRRGLYHPRLWQHVTFVIEPDKISQVQYFRKSVGHILSAATIKFNSMIETCICELLLLLQYLSCNNNLKSLVLEPSHCHIAASQSLLQKIGVPSLSFLFLKIVEEHTLTTVTIGCLEELLEYVPDILEILGQTKPKSVTKLGLASVKDDLRYYTLLNCKPNLFQPFEKLQILSLDYDIFNDTLLEELGGAKHLTRLVVHVHGIYEEHPGTSEQAWEMFKFKHPNCLLRLTLIHAFEDVDYLQSLLKNNMPLSHLKVLFCEKMNTTALQSLIRYQNTLKSLIWVDSLKNSLVNSYSLINQMGVVDHQQQLANLILVSWRCIKLEEIVILGYKYFEEDWIGVAKLRGDTLKNLQIAQSDIVSSGYTKYEFSQIISKILGNKWSPVQSIDLHPVLEDPDTGDSDEYLMPLLLADLH